MDKTSGRVGGKEALGFFARPAKGIGSGVELETLADIDYAEGKTQWLLGKQ